MSESRNARDWLAVMNGLVEERAGSHSDDTGAVAVITREEDTTSAAESDDIAPVSATQDLVEIPDVAAPTVDLVKAAPDVDELSVEDDDHETQPKPRRRLVRRVLSAPFRALRRIGGLSRRWLALVAVLLVGVVALGVFTGLRLANLRSYDDRVSARAAASAAASHEVLDLLTLSGASSADAQKQLTDLLSGSTGNFRQQFATNEQALVSGLVQAKVKQVGQVNAVGIVSIKGATATALVNGQSTVSHTGTAGSEVDYYRMQVTLQKIHGTWLVSDIGVIA